MALSRKRDEWLTILDDLEKSGMTHTQYAAKIGCHPASIAWWKRKVKKEQQIASTEAKSRQSQNFLPVEIEARSARAAVATEDSAAPEAFHELQGGARMVFAKLPSPSYLSQILREV